MTDLDPDIEVMYALAPAVVVTKGSIEALWMALEPGLNPAGRHIHPIRMLVRIGTARGSPNLTKCQTPVRKKAMWDHSSERETAIIGSQ